MKENPRLLLLSVFIFTLIGCTTIQTHIDNRDNYVEIPIETRRRLAIFFDYILGNYRLEDRSGVNVFEGNAGRIETRQFTFFEGNAVMRKVEVIQRERRGLLFTSITRYLRFIYNDGRSVEFQIDFRDGNYLTIHSASIGIIEINYHGNDGFHTGFDFIVNNERYGILAFYPIPFSRGSLQPSFFIREGNELQRDMALYILAAYLSHIRR